MDNEFATALPPRLTLVIGQRLGLRLPGAFGAGADWHCEVQAPSSEPACIQAVLLPAPAPPPGAGLPASWSRDEILQVDALRPGRCRLLLWLSRAWEPQRRSAQQMAEVEVS